MPHASLSGGYLLDFYRVDPQHEQAVTQLLQDAGIAPTQYVWSDATHPASRRCRVFWLTPAQEARVRAGLLPSV
jgi:hypothetical protein